MLIDDSSNIPDDDGGDDASAPPRGFPRVAPALPSAVDSLPAEDTAPAGRDFVDKGSAGIDSAGNRDLADSPGSGSLDCSHIVAVDGEPACV